MLHAWRSEPSARRYQPLRQIALSELRALLVQRAEHPVGPRAEGKFQWVVQAVGQPVGWISLTVTDRVQGIGTVGYTIGERFRGHGYATAAVRTLLPLAFAPDGFDLARLDAVAAVENSASRRVLEHARFACTGIAPGYLVINDVPVDHAQYVLQRRAWETTVVLNDPSSQRGS